jgi:pimeloyl-ACP methyl ester carboxylesterase
MISAITLVLVIALGISLLLYLVQDRLIFYPQPAPGSPPQALDYDISEVKVVTADGLSLTGWLAKPSSAAAERLPLTIYFGGNAEETSHMAASAGHFPGWSLLTVNYRGYGGNPGQPSEQALFADALAVHDFAARRPDVDPARIVAIGRSLGSGIAVYLAAKRPLAGVVLVTPYDSLRAVAQRHYPYAPVSLLLKHGFDSIERAPSIFVPTLMLAAQLDNVIPTAHARALFSKWGGPKTWHELAGASHNDLDADPAYWNAIALFLARGTAGL